MECSRTALLIVIMVLLCALCVTSIGWLGSQRPDRINVAANRSAHPLLPLEAAAVEDDVDEESPDQTKPSSCPQWNRTVEQLPESFNAQQFCSSFKETALSRPRRVWYGMMFSFELDMLEVVLQETSMLVDKYVIVESKTSHSKKKKKLLLSQIFKQQRFKSFLPKITSGRFVPRRSYTSGWDYERGQRNYVLQMVRANGIREGDVLLGNLDVDEVFSRKTVMRYKFCNSSNPGVNSFYFRYNLNCLQENSVGFYKRTVIYWQNRGAINLHKARSSVRPIGINVSNLRREIHRFDSRMVWHMSTFGSLQDIRFKLSNSAHKFARGNLGGIGYEVDHCIYNSKKRFLIDLYPDMLPTFMQRNVCRFKELGWIRSIKSS